MIQLSFPTLQHTAAFHEDCRCGFGMLTVSGRALRAQPCDRHTLLATLPLAQGVSISVPSAQGHACVWRNRRASERDQDRGNESVFSVCLIERWKWKSQES